MFKNGQFISRTYHYFLSDRLENSPERYKNGYSKLRSWAHSSLDLYKVLQDLLHLSLRIIYFAITCIKWLILHLKCIFTTSKLVFKIFSWWFKNQNCVLMVIHFLLEGIVEYCYLYCHSAYLFAWCHILTFWSKFKKLHWLMLDNLWYLLLLV